MAQDYQRFTVRVGDNTESASLGFNARTLIVNNPTPYWWYLPDSQTFIQPYALNAVYALPGTQRFNLRFQAPPGYNQPIPAGANAESYATFELFAFANAPAPAYSAVYGSDARINVSEQLSLSGAGASRTYVFPTAIPGGFALYIPTPTLSLPSGFLRGDLTLTNGQTFQSIVSCGIDMLSASTIKNGAFVEVPESFPAGASLLLQWSPPPFPAPSGILAFVIQY